MNWTLVILKYNSISAVYLSNPSLVIVPVFKKSSCRAANAKQQTQKYLTLENVTAFMSVKVLFFVFATRWYLVLSDLCLSDALKHNM